MKRLFVVFCLGVTLAMPVLAEAPDDPLAWLGRIAAASKQLNYSGTFIYQAGQQLETSRIAHLVDATGEYERLEVLDGSPREIIRANGAVRCVLPEQKTVIIDEPDRRRAFPAKIPVFYAGLAQNYRIRKGETARVAGYESQLIVLDPRDDLRYGHMLWAERQSGLLLKARTVSERGEIIEQFTFSDVRIGDIDRKALSPRYRKDESWHLVDTRGNAVSPQEAGWVLRDVLPGFTLDAVFKRSLGEGRGEVVHMVLSDGLATISVFVEPMGTQEPPGTFSPARAGAINIYKRPLNGHLVTALGEVPLRAVQRVSEAVEAAAR